VAPKKLSNGDADRLIQALFENISENRERIEELLQDNGKIFAISEQADSDDDNSEVEADDE